MEAADPKRVVVSLTQRRLRGRLGVFQAEVGVAAGDSHPFRLGAVAGLCLEVAVEAVCSAEEQAVE